MSAENESDPPTSRTNDDSIRSIASTLGGLIGSVVAGLLCLAFVGVTVILIATPNRYLNEDNSSQPAAMMANTVAIIICSGVAFGFGLAAVAAWYRNANTVVLLTVVNVSALLALDPIEKTILKDAASFGIAYTVLFLLLVIAGGLLFWQARRGAVMPRFHLAVTSRPIEEPDAAIHPPSPREGERTEYCESCKKEVVVDDDERCAECRWPV